MRPFNIKIALQMISVIFIINMKTWKYLIINDYEKIFVHSESENEREGSNPPI